MPRLSFFRHACAVTFSLIAGAAAASGVAVQVVDAAGKPVANAAVYAEAEAGQALPKTQRAGEIEQKGLKFLPLMTVIQTGSKISFPNNDKVRHHIYSFSPAHKFDQKLYSGTTATPQVFDRAGVVVLGCNIHDSMLAYIRIVDTPYYGKTDANGVVRIDFPGAGAYVLKAWHFNAVSSQPAEQPLSVKAGDAVATAIFKLPMKPPVVEDAAVAY